ncbi:MAG: neutral/alkaline non-lysosomal ceramidase N-terminal domain-containing protein, partial [Clostridia bacterium]|nr:neutral/alkaline non-lysosomal ceramidase N-terminal domain-containing protein [Clostridia bacterium]
MSEQFKVGVGRRDITPAVGAILAGYAPGRPSTSVHDPLHFTAFAFEEGGKQAIVATADLLYIEDPLMQAVKCAMSEKSGVPTENIIVCAIHTHSGPAV